MNLLLDTHVLLWAFADPDRITPRVREAIVDPRNLVAVSAVTIWEVEIKRALGKLTAPPGLAALCAERGFDELSVTHEHAEVAGRLPLHHSDPFDRVLIAQARVEQFDLVTSDGVFDQYDVRLLSASTGHRDDRSPTRGSPNTTLNFGCEWSLSDHSQPEIGSRGVAAAVVVVVGHHQVPTVEAVLAAVGHEVTWQPHTVFAGHREQVAAAATVDAIDSGFGGMHARSLPL